MHESGMLWNGTDEDGNVRNKHEKMKTLNMETRTLTGKGR